MNGISYREDFGKGYWWPDYDHAPDKCYAFVERKLKDCDYIINNARNHDVCIQAGGHAGIWANKLNGFFSRVLSFEPDPYLFACMERNCDKSVEIHNKALGGFCGLSKLSLAASAGSATVNENGKIEIDVVTIDSLKLDACDVIILDIEGYEIQALTGANKTICKFRPLIHLEAGKNKEQYNDFMRMIGYKVSRDLGRDVVYEPE